MRVFAGVLIFLFILAQYPLWLGKGGLLRMWHLERQLHAALQQNTVRKMRNAQIAADVVDLQEGTQAIEAQARASLGMIKKEEYFIQILSGTTP